MLGLLLGEEDEAGEPVFARQLRGDPEETLPTLEPLDSLDRAQVLYVPGAGLVASLRNVSLAGGRIVHGQHAQGRAGQQPLVLARRHEEAIADRGSKCDLVAAERTGHDQRIREEESSPRS
jgi:hypothetical protein